MQSPIHSMKFPLQIREIIRLRMIEEKIHQINNPESEFEEISVEEESSESDSEEERRRRRRQRRRRRRRERKEKRHHGKKSYK